MYLFKNLDEFYAVVQKHAVTAIDYVTEKMLQELNLQMASKKIGLNNNSSYTPTGEFYSAWKSDIATRLGQYFTSSVRYDGDSLSLDPDNFVHGSNCYEIDDVRDILPWIIFGGNSGDLFGKGFWTQSRDAWTPTISRMNKSFGKWIVEGFKYSNFYIKPDKILIISEIE